MLQPEKDGVQRATIHMESYVYSPNQLIVEMGKPVELSLENDSFLVPHISSLIRLAENDW